MYHPKTVKVFCVDTGESLQPSADDIFELPKDMEELPDLSVHIFLADLKPTRGEDDFRPEHINRAKELTLDKILMGRVRLF
jgi:hypothetical protein